MRLLGDLNWWAPGIFGRFVDRLGFSHVEEDDPTDDSAPGVSRGLAGS
jgi:hypothetical protein